MKLQIKDVFGIHRADIDIMPGETTLLASVKNGAGKSSAINAACLVLTPIALPEGLTKTDWAKKVVHDGAKEGYVMFDDGANARQITYPKCEIKTTKGTGMKPLDAWASGRNKLQTMDVKEKAKFLGELTGGKVSKKQLEEEMKSLNIPVDKSKRLIEVALANGFELASKAAEDWARDLKAEFKLVTGGTNWGSDKGLTFEPPGYTADLATETIDTLRGAMNVAKSRLEEGLGKQALYKAAGDKEALASEVTYCTNRIEESTNELIAAEEVLKGLSKQCQIIECSGCGLSGTIQGSTLLPVADDVNFASVAEIEAAQSKVVGYKSIISNAQMMLGIAKGKFDNADAQGEPVEVEPLRTKVQHAETRFKAFEAKAKGTDLHYRITDMLKAKDILAPDGLPLRALMDGIKKLNDRLQKACDIAGWDKVEIDRDLNFRFKGQLYHEYGASEGERMVCDVTFQIFWASAKEQNMVLIDRADLLCEEYRLGLLTLLSETGTTALVAMTCKKPPDLAAAGLGRTYIMENNCSALLEAQPA